MTTLPTQDETRSKFEELELRKRLDDLIKLGDSPGSMSAQQRGRDFERLLLDLFSAHGILRRSSYHTSDNKSQQIDGVIEVSGRISLIEVKWVESGLAASDLFAFLGKVESKFVGTIGIFISYVELSGNFVNALRAGRRQSILLVHGPDSISRIFRDNFPLVDYLNACLLHVSMDNSPHLSAEIFQANIEEKIEAVHAKNEKFGAELIKKLSAPAISPAALATADNEISREENSRVLLTIFPEIVKSEYPQSFRDRALAYLTSALNTLPKKELEMDRKFFVKMFPVIVLDPAYSDLFRVMANRFCTVTPETRSKVEEVLLAAWRENIRIYVFENSLAVVTDALWPGLDDQFKYEALRWFIEFANSSRSPNYPQVEVAKRQLAAPTNAVIRDRLVRDLVRSEFAGNSSDDFEWRRKVIEYSFAKIARIFPDTFKSIFDEVSSEFAPNTTPH